MMTRNLPRLANARYDVAVVGGGIYGACVAWDASLRGLSVVLLEQGDIGSGTSANSLKIIHGGFRYLQHGDFTRMRESIQEQMALMRIAPHLVHPLPVLIPTYGHGLRGKEVFACALAINDLIGFDRNRLDDPQKHIPRGRILSRRQVLELLPNIPEHDLTGGGVFHDGMVYNSERLLLSFLHSAESMGAEVANYVKVVGYLKTNDQVRGLEAEDRLSGERFQVEANVVVNACGPWLDQTEDMLSDQPGNRKGSWVKAFNILTRPLFSSYAVGLAARGSYSDDRALLNKGKRLLFMVPWRNCSLIGTSYRSYEGKPDAFRISEEDIHEFLQEINQAYPQAALTMKDVAMVNGGLLPGVNGESRRGDIQLESEAFIRTREDVGARNVISLLGVKFTTARRVAEHVVDRVFRVLGRTPSPSQTALAPLYGGNIGRFQEFLSQEMKCPPGRLSQKAVHRLIHNYGSSYRAVLRYLPDSSERNNPDGSESMEILQAEVRYALREEMAQRLSDVVFRRTELGTAGYPGDKPLNLCADILSQELGWSERRTLQELAMVRGLYPG
ncbi:glycerol-3-phosphate dehydrogenase/oxidase [uncultured Nitrospira sp.]|uniref:glycerol-3-phosphate dehydrogenase/oxidase n=1 Tax=uncultured Nitrospira sp. TaxID=157176 RepID=UPI0031402286